MAHLSPSGPIVAARDERSFTREGAMANSIGIYDRETKAKSVGDLFAHLTAGVSAVAAGQTIAPQNPTTLEINRKHTTGVILVICIILFPIGLLALLARPTETIRITATEADGKVRATATGNGDKRVIEAVRLVLEGDY